MTNLGTAWLGDDEAECMVRDMWAGRITEVNPEPEDPDDWWFTAVMLPVDGVGAVRTVYLPQRLVPDGERELTRLGAVVLMLTETVRTHDGIEGRSAVRLRRDELGRETWVRTDGARGPGAGTGPLVDPGSPH